MNQKQFPSARTVKQQEQNGMTSVKSVVSQRKRYSTKKQRLSPSNGFAKNAEALSIAPGQTLAMGISLYIQRKKNSVHCVMKLQYIHQSQIMNEEAKRISLIILYYLEIFIRFLIRALFFTSLVFIALRMTYFNPALEGDIKLFFTIWAVAFILWIAKLFWRQNE